MCKLTCMEICCSYRRYLSFEFVPSHILNILKIRTPNHNPSKRREFFTQKPALTSLKTLIFSSTAVKTSNCVFVRGRLFSRLLNNTFTHRTEWLQLCLFLTRSFSVKSRSEPSREFVVGRISRYVMSILRFLFFFYVFFQLKRFTSVELNTTH